MMIVPKYLKLNGPQGPLYIRADAIIVIASVNDQQTSLIKTNIWVTGQEDEFNIREPMAEVMRQLTS